MKQGSRGAVAALLFLTLAQVSFAAGNAGSPAAREEPDIVIGSSSKAMSLATPRTTPPAVVMPAGQLWTIETKDVNLANTFQRWAATAGWKVRWDAAKHVMLEAPDAFTGSFEDAVAAQLSSPGIAMSAYPLEVCFYPNTPPLARITRKGDQSKECQ